MQCDNIALILELIERMSPEDAQRKCSQGDTPLHYRFKYWSPYHPLDEDEEMNMLRQFIAKGQIESMLGSYVEYLVARERSSATRLPSAFVRLVMEIDPDQLPGDLIVRTITHLLQPGADSVSNEITLLQRAAARHKRSAAEAGLPERH